MLTKEQKIIASEWIGQINKETEEGSERTKLRRQAAVLGPKLRDDSPQNKEICC